MKFAAWVSGLYAATLLVAVAFVAALVPADQVGPVLAERAPLVVSMAALVLALCFFAVRWFFGEYVTAVRRLTEQVGVLIGANQDLKLETEGAGEVAELAAAVNRLADDRRSLRRDVEARARESGARLEEERNRLAALMSELAEGVLVCNAEGRILLYNERARQLFSGDEALLGLGRSLFGLIDR